MTDAFGDPPEATPLEPQEREGLRQSWITNQRDLNEAEQENIIIGAVWARNKRQKKADLLTPKFISQLHRHMFGDVWNWAGEFRRTERNIGIEAYRIPVELQILLDDVRYWIEHRTYSLDEIAIRFHHRLVAIHPFPNGNGRHSRLMADLQIERLGGEAFQWGGGSLTDIGELRRTYIDALKLADNHEIGPLLEFARS